MKIVLTIAMYFFTVLAAVGTVSNINSIINGIDLPDNPGFRAGYYVGLFGFPLLLLLVGYGCGKLTHYFDEVE